MGIVGLIVRKTRSLSRMFGPGMPPGGGEKSQREVCEMLEAYHASNDMYQNIQAALYLSGQWSPEMKSMRNPTSAVVEFYASTVWPGKPLEVVTDTPAVRSAVEDIWRRSNWQAQKQVAVRQAAITGDVFFQAATTASGKPYINVVLTKNVTGWTEDNAGNIVWLRYEVARRPEPGEVFEVSTGGTNVSRQSSTTDARQYFHTEIWTRDEVRTYKHYLGYNKPETELGTPTTTPHGLGFVPWVRACFRDVGDQYGYPPIWPALDKIDEVNLKATRLAQMLFLYNDAFWALKANAVDKDGRPMPPPMIRQDGVNKAEGDTLKFGGGNVVKLPGNSELQCLVPPIDFTAHAAAIQSDLDELKNDLPELRFYELMQQSGVSGVALAYMLAPAIARVIEVRGNLERALAKVDMMCITLGQRRGMYLDAGGFDDGLTDHSFAERDAIPLTQSERVDIAVKRVGMGVPLSVALQREGDWTDADILALQSAQLNATVAAAGRTAGPEADILTQSAARVAAAQTVTPNMDRVIADAVGGAVERSLDAMTASLAEFISGQGGARGGVGRGVQGAARRDGNRDSNRDAQV